MKVKQNLSQGELLGHVYLVHILTQFWKNESRVSLEAPETVPRHPIIKANKPGCTLKARQCVKVFFDMTMN